MSDVVKFYPKDAAKDPDNVLEQAVGAYGEVFLIGYNKEGILEIRSSTNFKTANIIFAIEAFKMKLFLGDYDVELRLHPDVKSSLKVRVESTTPIAKPEEATAAAPAGKDDKRRGGPRGDAKSDAKAEGKTEARPERKPRPARPAAKE